MPNAERFWMCHRLDITSAAPANKRHNTKEAAVIEARRMAEQSPRALIGVLELVDVYTTAMPIEQVPVIAPTTVTNPVPA